MSSEQERAPRGETAGYLAEQYGKGPEKVLDRFRLYEFAEPAVDIEAKVFESLDLTSNESWVDIGTSDGHFLHMLLSCGHKGELIGVEPNTAQFNYAPRWEPINPDPVRAALERALGHEHGLALADEFLATKPNTDKIKLLKGTANVIPLEDDFADVLSVMFMLYHLPESKQPQAFAEFKRVLKPNGRFVLATSGTDNKVRHRMLEQQIANNFDHKTTAPKLMNAGFNTERAEVELPKYFRYVFAYKHDSKMVIDDVDRVDAYLDSLRSLRDQFDPVPDEFAFEDALVDVVLPQIEHDLSKYGRFIDLIRRSIFICGDGPGSLILPADFAPVAAQET